MDGDPKGPRRCHGRLVHESKVHVRRRRNIEKGRSHLVRRSRDHTREHHYPGIRGVAGARLERVLARASEAPLREGNSLELLKNGPKTYDDWLQAISGPSAGSTWTTTSSRTTPRASGSPRRSLRRPPRVCASASSTTGSVRWTYRENSGESYAMLAWRSGRSTHRR